MPWTISIWATRPSPIWPAPTRPTFRISPGSSVFSNPLSLRTRWPRFAMLSLATSPTAVTVNLSPAISMTSPATTGASSALCSWMMANSWSSSGASWPKNTRMPSAANSAAISPTASTVDSYLRTTVLPVEHFDVVGGHAGDEVLLGDEPDQRPGRAGPMDVDGEHALHRVDADPGRSPAVDHRDRNLVEAGL